MLSEITHVDGKKATVDLQSNVTLEELIAGAAVKFYCEDGKSSLSARSSELGDFLFIKNYSREESSKVCIVNHYHTAYYDDIRDRVRIVGYDVCGMAYPCGGVNNDERVATIIKEKTGVRYSRTIASTHLFDLPKNDIGWIRL